MVYINTISKRNISSSVHGLTVIFLQPVTKMDRTKLAKFVKTTVFWGPLNLVYKTILTVCFGDTVKIMGPR